MRRKIGVLGSFAASFFLAKSELFELGSPCPPADAPSWTPKKDLALDETTEKEYSSRQKFSEKFQFWRNDGAFPFLHGLALADADPDVQILLLSEATRLMRKRPSATAFPTTKIFAPRAQFFAVRSAILSAPEG